MRHSKFLLLMAAVCALCGCGSQTSRLVQTSAASTASSSSASSSTPATTTVLGGIAVPEGATILSNLQTRAGNWRSFGQAPPDYTDCSAPCAQSTWAEVYGVANPSKSGNATMFDLDPKIPYADVLFTAGLIGQNSPQLPDTDHSLVPTLHHFIYDADFYVADPKVTQSLEFDISLWMSGSAGMTFGHQCNNLGDHKWDVWDNGSGRWVSTAVPCQLTVGWNHLTLQMERDSNDNVVYQSIALNGVTTPVNLESPSVATPAGWWGVAANYQMDSNSVGAPNTTYLDNLSVAAW